MKYLTIALANQIYGLELSQVKEWLGYMDFTPIASNDPATVGTFDYRGRRATVIDLRARLGLPVNQTAATTMIAVEFRGETFALIVDRVLGSRDSSMPARMNESNFTPMDLSECVMAPRRDYRIAA